MNIFVLDLNPEKCAEYHVNRHVTKMCIEYSQILCSVHHVTNSDYLIPYKLSHKNHPCSIWARECIENYQWLTSLGLHLCQEYTFRYGKRHKSQNVIEWALTHKPKIRKNNQITSFALAMPDEFKLDNPVSSYRNYYINGKTNLLAWKNRPQPYWIL
jgi:hypothetical protein